MRPPRNRHQSHKQAKAFTGGINFMRRIWPIGVMILGARMLLGSFMTTTAKGESFFDYAYTPIGLILIVVGGYFFMKDYD
jgi:hypothetical protein